MHRHKKLAGILLLTIAVSSVALLNQAALGITAVVMLYLLVVLAGAYYLQAPQAIGLALLTVLLINFLFVEPRYTFRIANVESWGALIGFLMVSLVVTSLMRRLQGRTKEAETARSEAQFARTLAERLAQESQPRALLYEAARLLQGQLSAAVCIVRTEDHNLETIPHDTACRPDPGAVVWVMKNARSLGPGTDNWSDAGYLMMPFSRLPGHDPVLVCDLAEVDEHQLVVLRNLCDQVSLAYQRAVSACRAQQAELQARTEAMQNALLASLSHDMRTPLTAILGAASALESQEAEFDAAVRAQMLTSIRTEADYLCRATENILSLARLNALGSQGLVMDWQSPEEIVGSTLARYRIRESSCDLRAHIASDALIRADAGLLSQALANLLDNALVMHSGPEPLLVSVRQQADCLTIAVADRGPGFPPDFDPGSLQKFRHRHGRGFGLGLVIVHTIATLHDARLVFAARQGGGTEVGLCFPIVQHGNDDGDAGDG